MEQDKNQNSGNKNTVSNSSIQAGGNVHIGDIVNIHQHTPAAGDAPPPPPKVSPQTLEELRELVGRNRLKEVLEQLLELTAGRAESQAEVIALSRRWNDLQRQQRQGLISRQEATVAANQITMSILEVIGEL